MATGDLRKKYIVGVDLGGTNVRAAVLDRETEQVVARGDNLPSLAMEGVDLTAAQIAKAATIAIEKAGITTDEVLGVGVAVPGHVKPAEGMVMWAPNFRDQWRKVQIVKPIQDRLGLPVHIGNDANLAALGEFTYGVGRAVRHLAMITLGKIGRAHV